MTYLIPLRYFLVIVRGIFLKGVGLEMLWPQALALLAWGAGADPGHAALVEAAGLGARMYLGFCRLADAAARCLPPR